MDGDAMFHEGDRVRVKPEFDIPPILRGDIPSEGVIDHFLGGTLVVIVDGKAVPYQPEAVERVG